MNTYIAVTVGATLIAMVATLLAIRLARALRIVDAPGLRKVHAVAIPRTGGLAIMAAMLAMVVPVLTLDNTIGESFRHIQLQVIGLLVGGCLMFALGLVDDIYGLRARTKLCGQIVLAAGLCGLGVRIEEITLPGSFTVEFGWLSWPLTMLWIVGVTNALNLIDGLDGLAAGIAAIACAVIAMLAVLTGQPVMAVLMLALLGSLCGFLVFNFNPARIFMGDCGSLFLGFTLGGASVLCAMKTATVVGLAIPVLAMGIPIFDMLFSMLRRMLARRSPFAPDRGHIHHRLLDLGLSHGRAVIALYTVTALVAALGMSLLVTRSVATVAVFCCLIALLVAVFRVIGAVRLRESLAALQRNLAIARQTGAEKRCFEESQLRLREASTFEAWWDAVCDAAEQLTFALLALTVTEDDGSRRLLIWRRPGEVPSLDRLLRLSFRAAGARGGSPLHIEVHVDVNGSLEAAGRRGALFGRLLDEYTAVGLPVPHRHERESRHG